MSAARGSGGGWRPLLDGALAARARAAVEDIAAALSEPRRGVEAVPLAGEGVGVALLHAYLEREQPDRAHGAVASRFVDAACDAVAGDRLGATLYNGVAGVGWVTEHLYGSSDDDDPNSQTDELVAALLASSPWRGPHDLVRGLVGFGVYLLERARRPSARRALELLAVRLDELADRRDGRATWRTDPVWLGDHARTAFRDGARDVGVAHGVPGIVAILAGMVAVGVGGARVRGLFEEAFAWVLDRERDGGFPSYAERDVCARPGWCYGAPGVAAVLAAAATATHDEELLLRATGVARRAAAATVPGGSIVDAGVCHGAAGLAHLFNRLYQRTGELACRDAARTWFERVLSLRQAGEGVAGFVSWSGKRWEADASVLTGAAGIALALLSAVSETEPCWDRMLLASLATA